MEFLENLSYIPNPSYVFPCTNKNLPFSKDFLPIGMTVCKNPWNHDFTSRNPKFLSMLVQPECKLTEK